jgi:excinuclease ABC subunit A
VDVPCPECRGSRYSRNAYRVKYTNKAGNEKSLPELMEMDVNTAIVFCRDMKTVYPRLKVLQDLGLGYLTLGEETPSLSGGEAQRLKLASEMGRTQEDSVFVFDEPTIGLHPLDVETLLGVFRTLISNGATVVVIEHDLDVIRNCVPAGLVLMVKQQPDHKVSYGEKAPAGKENNVPAGFFYRLDTENDRSQEIC